MTLRQVLISADNWREKRFSYLEGAWLECGYRLAGCSELLRLAAPQVDTDSFVSLVDVSDCCIPRADIPLVETAEYVVRRVNTGCSVLK